MMIGNIGVDERDGVELELETGSLDDVIDCLRSKTQGRKAAEFARQAGVSTGYVYDVLKRRYPPGPKMLAALGVHKVTYYEADFAAGVAGADRADDGDIQVALPDESTPI